MKLEGVLTRIKQMDSLYFFLALFALLPLVLKTTYGPINVPFFITDSIFKDFLFKMIGLAAVGILIPVKELRWGWWIVLLSHFITKQALFQGDASAYLLNMALGLILFSIVFHRATERVFHFFCLAVLISVIANLGLQCLQVIQVDPFHTFWKLNATGTEAVQIRQVATGFLGNPVTLGIYYVITMPLLLVSTGRYYPFFSIAVLIGIALTSSKIALFLAVIVFILSGKAWSHRYGDRFKNVLEVGFFSFLIMIPLSLTNASNLQSAFYNRWNVWKGAFEFHVDPLLGDGLSSWALRRFYYNGSIWPQAHNEYVQIFYELGIIGLAMIVFYVIRFLRRVKYSLNLSTQAAFQSVAVTAIVALVFFPFHLAQTAIPFIVSLAYLERVSNVGIA